MKIILNILTHGNELIGLKVVEEIQKLNIDKSILQFHTANRKAYKKGVRFIDKDLNRSFPGNLNGNYEERLATKILPTIKEADVVLDIHSTTSGLKNSIIVTKLDKDTKKYLNIISPKYVLFMKQNKCNALISNAKVGLAFEYGSDDDLNVVNNIVSDIKKLLAHFGLVQIVKSLKKKTKYFKINREVKKPDGYKLLPEIKNFKLIRKGEGFAKFNNQFLIARRDFYPILFGNENYETVFGFEGVQITI